MLYELRPSARLPRAITHSCRVKASFCP